MMFTFLSAIRRRDARKKLPHHAQAIKATRLLECKPIQWRSLQWIRAAIQQTLAREDRNAVERAK